MTIPATKPDYEKIEPWPLEFQETPGEPLSYRVDGKMRSSKDKTRLTVNPSLTLAGIPPETFDYRLGNRSALEWVIDQYQVSTDKRSGITSDPNRGDDEQYIVRLVLSLSTHDAVVDPPKAMCSDKCTARGGDGGSALCDASGRLVAIHIAGTLHETDAVGYGVPLSHLQFWLRNFKLLA